MHFGNLFSKARPALPKSFGAPFDRSAPTVFMHIPKTSGTALMHGLAEAIAPRHVVRGFDRVLFGDFCAFHSLAPSERSRVYVEPSDLPTDGDFVAGHMAFSTLCRRYSAANYLTVLREPLSRILSHWLYWRAVSENLLEPLGEWADYVRQARKPLRDFLSCPDVACQTDNLGVRMLLWPHRLIPDGGFIKSRNDNALMDEAMARLKQFAFADVIENPRLQANLKAWLGRPVQYPLANETAAVPFPLKRPLHDELTPEAIDLLETRARLDRELWTFVAQQHLGTAEVEALRERAILRNVARHSWLMVA